MVSWKVARSPGAEPSPCRQQGAADVWRADHRQHLFWRVGAADGLPSPSKRCQTLGREQPSPHFSKPVRTEILLEIWHFLFLLITIHGCVQSSNTHYPILGSERKFLPTDFSSQAGAHCQKLPPKKGYPAGELRIESLTFRKGQLLLRGRQGPAMASWLPCPGHPLQTISEKLLLPVLSTQPCDF